jgi:hypothetical protein
MPTNQTEKKSLHKSQIVTNLLTSALKLWLRSQVTQVSQLEVEMKASNRQILSGCIPWVSIVARHAIYQGLHLSQVQLVAENIRINIGSVLKGQPLRLLETVPVRGELIQLEEDLNSSLSSSLLSNALNDVLVQLLPEHCQKSKSICWQKISLNYSQVLLFATSTTGAGETKPLDISLGLELLGSHELQLTLLQLKSDISNLLNENNQGLYLNLGPDVDIQELSLTPGKLLCRGRINVNP